tara:strand:+ start:1723 stop:2208 length:486 start_codon:yes stop_codon:yes gene_type:complete
MSYRPHTEGHILSLDLACYRAVHDYTGGVVAVAAVFGWSANTLQNKLNPTQAQNKLTAFEAEQILQLTKDVRILDALCQPVNALWIWGEPYQQVAGDMAMLDNVTELVQRTGELAGEIQQALADGVVDRDEIKRMQYALYRLQQSGVGAVKRAEQFSDSQD